MLELQLPRLDLFDEEKNEFVTIKPTHLSLEHSLISLSKWEAKWNKPFLSSEKTDEEVLDYIRCMTLTQNVDPKVYFSLSADNIKDVNKYIESPMTATVINRKDGDKKSKEIITAEIIYYWMITLNIPFECQKWHINRLLTLIEVCSIKNSPQKKMSRKDIYSRNRELNAIRRAKHHTRG